MKKRLLIIVALLSAAVLSAQTRKGKITGIVIGKSSKAPIEYSTVALHNAGNAQVITGTTTNSQGRFVLDKITDGDYIVECSYIGCKPLQTSKLSVSKSTPTVDLGVLILDDSSTALDEVVVQGQRSTYIQTIDKKIFNVGSDLMSSSGSVSDLLQNIPSVQVDVDGTISLRGNENVQVLINGKPSVTMKNSTNRGSVLQQIPANSIERIEVITNPSAQFKPDGTSGIINIILKKEHNKGYSGTLISNAGNDDRYNAALSLGYNNPKVNITGNYGIRLDRRDRFNYNDRTLTDAATGTQSFVSQNDISRARSTAHITGLGFQWNIDDKNRFEVGGNYTYMTFPRKENNMTIQRTETQTLKDYNRQRFDKEVQKQADALAAFVHEFGKDHTLTVDYTNATEDGTEDNKYTNIYQIPIQMDTKDNTLIKQKDYENLIRAIYENSFHKNIKLVLGYELEADKSDMRYFAEDYMNSVWVKNTGKSNDFLFNETVHSLYATYGQTLGKFGFLAGLRGEQSYIKSKLLTLNQTVPNNYFLFYPTIHSSYKLNDHNELQLNYSLRVNRPEGDDLNPFPEYQDPYNVRMGNPNLMPEKIHSIEVGYQWKDDVTTLVATLFYRNAYNKMTTITKVLADDVVQTTKENMSSSQASGLELIANSAIGNFATFNINTNLFYNQIDASDLGYSNKKGAMAWSTALNTNFNLFRNAMLQINARYRSSELNPQGNRAATFITNLGTRYDILPRYNLSLTATVSDLFDTYKDVNIINTPALYQRFERRRTPRIFYVGFSYKFGGNANKKHKATELKYDESL